MPKRLKAMGDIGQAVRTRRQALGLTMKVLSELTGVSEPEISLIERNRRRPQYDTIVKLVPGLNWTVAELEEDINDPSRKEDSERAQRVNGRKRREATGSTSSQGPAQTP